ncbi:RNA polymerase sigma factor [Chloroflexota bacterium]
MDEATAVALVREGNAEAFSDIVEHYHAPIHRYLYRLTGDYELTQDLVQDTFIRAYENMIKTDHSLALRAWLYKIAENNARQYYRRKKLVAFIRFSFVEADDIPAGNRKEETTRSIAIKEALLKVPYKNRVCMVLHFFEGFKYREIAETLGISKEAVRKRVARGSLEFRRHHSGEGVENETL